MTAPDLEVPVVPCAELHCVEEHGIDVNEHVLSPLIVRLAEMVHSRHDSFPWRLCTFDICRDTAQALGLRP